MSKWLWILGGGAVAYMLLKPKTAAAAGVDATTDAIKKEMTRATGIPYTSVNIHVSPGLVIVRDMRNDAIIVQGTEPLQLLAFLQTWMPGFMIGAGSPGYQGQPLAVIPPTSVA